VLIARAFETIAREGLDQKQRHLDETLKRPDRRHRHRF